MSNSIFPYKLTALGCMIAGLLLSYIIMIAVCVLFPSDWTYAYSFFTTLVSTVLATVLAEDEMERHNDSWPVWGWTILSVFSIPSLILLTLLYVVIEVAPVLFEEAEPKRKRKNEDILAEKHKRATGLDEDLWKTSNKYGLSTAMDGEVDTISVLGKVFGEQSKYINWEQAIRDTTVTFDDLVERTMLEEDQEQNEN